MALQLLHCPSAETAGPDILHLCRSLVEEYDWGFLTGDIGEDKLKQQGLNTVALQAALPDCQLVPHCCCKSESHSTLAIERMSRASRNTST